MELRICTFYSKSIVVLCTIYPNTCICVYDNLVLQQWNHTMLSTEMAVEYVSPIDILPGRSIEQCTKCSLHTLTLPSTYFLATTMD